jgi:prepilin peptidase CpaA
MTTGGLLMCVPMLGLLTWAAAVDVRSRRIPNWLTFGLVLAGLAQSFTWARTVGPGDAGLGLLTGFGLTFVLFALGALGGGDVKLLAGVGAWLGPMPALVVFAAAAVIGMVIVLAQAAAQGRLAKLFRNSAVIAVSLATSGTDAGAVGQAAETGRACSDGGGAAGRPLPYAVPVLLATLLVVARMS